ncbi:hypothetical protein CRG98_022773 [Punica granatum]|uniref:Uncharacterized protein n=1 Tax=Punica granatum TaxID=22663 RepID=A0A2I0JKJ8_PUNGR|nr:hypothetical protein CRG98_022773 [Punica granatum]
MACWIRLARALVLALVCICYPKARLHAIPRHPRILPQARAKGPLTGSYHQASGNDRPRRQHSVYDSRPPAFITALHEKDSKVEKKLLEALPLETRERIRATIH